MVGIDWREQQQGVIDYIRSRGYFVVDSEPTREIMTQHARVALVKRDELGYNAVRTPMDLPIAKEVIRAVENARGDVVLLPTMGGSVPLGAMERAAQTHTITMPIANYDDNQHTANENLRLKICGTVWERWLRCWRWNNHLESPIMDRVRCVLSAFVLTAGAASQIGHAPVALQSCSVPGVDRSARCGAIEVLENPDQPRSRKLEIHFAVISATKGHARPDPIVPLLGGPGEAAIETGQMFVERLAPMLNDRDLLLVDQRGAGQSGALRCHFFTPDDPVESLQNLFPPACVESCAKGLATHADLTQYSYRRFADDLEKVRRTLGYGPLNLFAGSYGTRAAQVFVRAYPSSVRTIYLGSVVPIDIAQPLPFAKAAQSTLDRTLAACDADPACHSAFPRVRDEFSQIMEGLASGRVFVKVPGHEGTVALSQGRVAEWFRSLLYRPSSAAGLPWLIDRASKGDWAPIVKGILEDERDADSGLSLGLLLSITCSDDVPFVHQEEVAAATRNTFLADWRLRQQEAACKLWPHSIAPASDREIHTKIPTMFVSGDFDGGTPLWFTRHAAPSFQNRVEVIMSNRGHTEWAPCIETLYQRFLDQGSVYGLDASACSHLSRPPFKTE